MAADPLAGKTVAGYRLERLLGRGAMAAVYAARDAQGSAVALKMLIGDAARDRELIRRFEREAKLGARVAHPGLCAVLGSGVDRGIRWLAMTLIDGGAWDDRLDRHGAPAWTEAVRIVRAAGEAVAVLHRIGVIHRDLKPGNLLLGGDGRVAVIDLGFAKVPDERRTSDHGEEAAELTMNGVALGSPAYMPPEQVIDAKAVTPAADVYALAATLFHGVAGKPPFHGGGAMQIMTRVMNEVAPRLRSVRPDAPRALDALLHRCLHKDPAKRPADADAFVRELDAVVAAPDRIGSDGWWARLRRWFGRG